MEKTILTIITVCFNIKDEIERTCQSIVNQTWQNFEWIVIDGGSTDGTVDILKNILTELIFWFQSLIKVYITP